MKTDQSWRASSLALLLVVALTQCVMLMTLHDIAGGRPWQRLTPFESTAIVGGELMLIVLVAMYLYWHRTHLIGYIRLTCRNTANRGDAYILLGVMFMYLLTSAHWLSPRLHMENPPALLHDLWQASAIFSSAIVLGLDVERRRSGLLPPLSVSEVIVTAVGLSIGSFFIAPGVPIAFCITLVLVYTVLVGRLSLRPNIAHVGAGAVIATVVTMLLVISAWSPYRRDRILSLINAYLGSSDNWYWSYLVEAVQRTIQQATLFGAEHRKQLFIPGSDEYLLTGTIFHYGLIPASIIAVSITVLTIWSFMRLSNARVQGGRNVVRNIGLSTSCLQIVSLLLSVPANFGILRIPFEFGTPLYSPRVSMMLLGAVSLLAAMLMPCRTNPPSLNK